MIEFPLRSYVSFTICELCDALDNLNSIKSRLDDEGVKSLVSDIYNDVENAIAKLQNIAL